MSDPDATFAATSLRGLLTDTWWYALSRRMSETAFRRLAQQRVEEGFSAIQLVVGIPPEVGPEHEFAASEVGPAWSLDGAFNKAYLALAKERLQLLNQMGLTVIVYGAWGHQIKWLGRERMAAWWREIVRTLDGLDVIYCLTGESNLMVGAEELLLPDRSTDSLFQFGDFLRLPPWLIERLRRIAQPLLRRWKQPKPHLLDERRRDWGYVLRQLSEVTERPIIVHTNSGEAGINAVANAHLLAANTTQTGHSYKSRQLPWEMPFREKQEDPDRLFLNLEPWYEGITGRFRTPDQLFAYWVSMLAGADSYFYGAHGIWNVGDGHFLAHWGSQSFQQAAQLPTPRLLGFSHQLLRTHAPGGKSILESENGKLRSISRAGRSATLSYYPEISNASLVPSGQVWLPCEGRFSEKVPEVGQVVIVR